MTHWNKLVVERHEVPQAHVTVYRLSGVLTNSTESYAFLDQLSERTRKGPIRIVLNMDQVEHVTSVGVGILAACYTSVTNTGGQIRLAAVPLRARAILNVVKLLETMGEQATEEDAVRSLTG